MSLDQNMIIALLNCLKNLNVRFRGNDITDDTRKALRPIMNQMHKDFNNYVELLREPEPTTKTPVLKAFRVLVKKVRNAPQNLLVAIVQDILDFVKKQLNPIVDPPQEDETIIVETIVIETIVIETDDDTINPSDDDDNDEHETETDEGTTSDPITDSGTTDPTP